MTRTLSRSEHTRARACVAAIWLAVLVVDGCRSSEAQKSAPDPSPSASAQTPPASSTATAAPIATEASRAAVLPTCTPEACEHACLQRDQAACLARGILLLQGPRAPESLSRAKDPFEGACRAREPTGCGALGGLYLEGLGVSKDVARGIAMYKDACDPQAHAG